METGVGVFMWTINRYTDFSIHYMTIIHCVISIWVFLNDLNFLFQNVISQNIKETIGQLIPEYLPHEANINDALVTLFYKTSHYLTMIPRTKFQTFQTFEGMKTYVIVPFLVLRTISNIFFIKKSKKIMENEMNKIYDIFGQCINICGTINALICWCITIGGDPTKIQIKV